MTASEEAALKEKLATLSKEAQDAYAAIEQGVAKFESATDKEAAKAEFEQLVKSFPESVLAELKTLKVSPLPSTARAQNLQLEDE